MNQSEFDEFRKILSETAEYYGKEMTAASINIWWRGLQKVDLLSLQNAFNEHIQSSRFMPSISDVLENLKSQDGRPNAEEAWAICAPSLNNEGVTIVWTDEMASAFGVALGLQNDRIAARMAFKEAYENYLKNARRSGKPVRWIASLGHDVSGREGPLMKALQAGLLTDNHVDGLLPNRNEPSLEIKKLTNKVAISKEWLMKLRDIEAPK